MAKSEKKPMVNEALAERIRNILTKTCPAFSCEVTPMGRIWHHCHCAAQEDSVCTCVWLLTSKCLAGQWPQLDFITKVLQEKQIASTRILKKAKRVIAETEKAQTLKNKQ